MPPRLPVPPRSPAPPRPHEPSAQELLRNAAGLRVAGELQRAVEAYREAIRLDPACALGYHALGEIFAGLKDFDTALIFFNAAATLRPDAPEIQHNLGSLHLRRSRLVEAEEHFRRAIALCPREPRYHNHLGAILLARGLPEQAEICLYHALALAPGFAETHANLGFLWASQLRLAEAESCYRQALRLAPELAQAHVNLSHLLLRRGAFAEGWLEAEWRWRWKEFPSPARKFSQPLWRGEAIVGQTLLLHAEQGFGDTLQMLRYVPLAAARGARIVLEVHPELRELAAALPGVDHLLTRGDSLPAFDLHCPLMSLPLAFQTEPDTIPAAVPYLHPTALPPGWITASGRLRVGLVWAGNPANVVDGKRSLPAEQLCSLLQLPEVDFYSLQLGAALPQGVCAGLPVEATFAQTAAAVQALDLVIAVDTAVAHLAGALGKPVWILLPALADWRWGLDREDSPWYPTARLFRQPNPDDWQPVLERVAQELALLSRSG